MQSDARAQTANESSLMTVRVEGGLSINAVESLAEISHNETNGLQWFPWQFWDVTCNNDQGAVVTLETDQAFTHTLTSTSKRNAALIFLPAGAPGWRITNLISITDYAAGNEVARVSSESDAAGNGRFRLRVVYLEEDFNDTLNGAYELTVTGTIVPK